MFNVAVINLKSLIKYILKIIIVIVIITMIFNFALKKSISFGYDFNTAYISMISSNLAISTIHEEEGKNLNEKSLLGSAFALFYQTEKVVQKDKQENVEFTAEIEKNPENIVENEEVISNTEKLPTKVVVENNKTDKFTDVYGSVKIKNESKHKLTPDMVKPTVDFNNKHDILIFHTHTCESYTKTADQNYVETRKF